MNHVARVGALILAGAVLGAGGVRAQGPGKLNVVIFITDDQSQGDSIPYGDGELKTPNMERVAREGVLFTRAFVASPSCAPSRAAMLTGLMPPRNGAESNHSK